MPKNRKRIQVQIYSKGTGKPKSYSIPLRIIGWWIFGLVIIVLGFMFWLPDNMINLKNFRIFEISKEQRAMQLTANKLEKQISEANSQIEGGRNLRNKIDKLAGISHKLKNEESELSKDFTDSEHIKKTLETLRKMRTALMEDEQYAKSLPLLHPVREHKNITNGFGMIHDPLTNRQLLHRGVDFAIKEGDTVIATGDGIIDAIINHKYGFGTSLEIQHSPRIKTIYSHLQNVLVQAGKPVKKGQAVAVAGKSGSVLWPVLHYEVHFDNQPINPEDYFITP
ncbi:MAG: peptidoglycan DD-metalloendopeptidase family protein [Fibromonadales bacterium]|nr:peptidoglycan DD-metalloendopeptidase family protein [Fibromonadales bacterium]